MQQMIVHEDATADRGLKDQGMMLVIIVQFSEIGIAFEWFLLAIYLVGFDEEIQDEI